MYKFKPNHWIGTRNIRGAVKFWYYKYRGWTYFDDLYYGKPERKKK